jgi:dihydrofolate reductase
MRRVRYQVACSLDGFIAGPQDEFDWIVSEPTFDFDALYAQFDILIMGRRTYDIVRGLPTAFRDKQVIVASRSLAADSLPGAEVVGDGLLDRIEELRAQPGGDIWLFGGGELFAYLLQQDVVDTVEPAIIPILLGAGIAFLPSPAVRRSLELTRTQTYPSGIVLLEYNVKKSGAVADTGVV